MNPLVHPSYLLPPLLAAAFVSVLCFLVARQARRSPAHRSFALFLLAVAVWSFLIFAMRSSPDTERALLWERLLIPVMLASSPAFYTFTRAYTRLHSSWTIALIVLLYLTLVVGLGSFGLLVARVELRSYGYAPIFAPSFYPLALWAYGWIILGMLNIYRAYRRSRVYAERNRLLYILMATTFPLAGTALDIFPVTYPTSILGNVAFAAITAVAMRRYHLLDISLVVRKGLAYLMMSALVAVPYVAVILVATQLFQGDQARPIVYVSLLVILALVLQPLWSKVQLVVDRIFFRHRSDSFHAIEEFTSRTRSIADLEQPAAELVDVIRSAMQADGVALLLPITEGEFAPVAFSGRREIAGLQITSHSPIALWLDREQRPLEQHHLDMDSQLQALTGGDRAALRAAGATLLVPLRMREHLSGILVLGAKLAEAPYSKEELTLLSLVATQSAVLLDDARLYQSVRVQLEQLQVAQQQLIQSGKLAAIGELVSGVAHEINNPLAGISVYTQLLLRRGLDANVEESLELIYGETQRVTRIVQNLLSFARERQPENRPLSINDALSRTLELRSYDLKLSNIELTVDLDPGNPVVFGDLQQLEQVFLNIVNNAQQAMATAGGRGCLEVKSRRANGNVWVTFTDDGPGIPAEVIDRVFDPFFTTKEVGRGTGLGLSICYGIVKEHGGSIWVESPGSGGSIFTVELPLADVAPVPLRGQSKRVIRGPVMAHAEQEVIDGAG